MKDRQAEFLEHFLKHQDDIRAFISSLVRDRHACDDILQEVAVTLWSKFDEFDRDRRFGAWARGIAYRKVLQAHDKDKRFPVLFSPETIEAVLEAYDSTEEESSEIREALTGCIQSLPSRSQKLVSLRYEEAMTLAGVAEVVSSTLDAVHKALSRIREALRKCIEKEMAAV